TVHLHELADGILARESSRGEWLAEHDYRFRSRTIVRCSEPAPLVDRNSEKRQQRCGDHLGGNAFRIARTRHGDVRGTEGGHRRKRFRSIAPIFVVVDGRGDGWNLRRLLVEEYDLLGMG